MEMCYKNMLFLRVYNDILQATMFQWVELWVKEFLMTASTAAKHGLGIKMASSDCATYLNQFQPAHGLIN